MTIDIANTDSEITVLPPARPVQSEAIGQLMAHADAMAAAKQLGDALADTDMVPKDYKGKPGNAAAAILYGAELGLNPIQSLQQIFVVHGSPAIYARTAVALVKRHGIVVETLSSANDAVTVHATDPRTGQHEQSTWDIARATLAGYTKNEKYKTDPQAMLYAKAAMEVCRKLAPDILLGIPYSREELEMEQRQQVQSQRPGQGIAALRERAQAAQQAVESAGEPKPAAAGGLSDSARRKWLNRMFGLLGAVACTEREEQLVVLEHITGRDAIEHRDALTDDELKAVVNQLNAWDKADTLGTEINNILGPPAAPAAESEETQS